MNRNLSRLYDIQEAIEKIIEKINTSKFFELNEIEQYGIIYLLQVIGEAARGLTESYRQENSQIPWIQIISFRNFIVHQYFEVDLAIINDVLEKDLSILQKQISDLINKAENISVNN
jgi:uncharacterized protein with HEPN domain